MKISYNWLKQFIDTTKTPQELSTILTDIGLEVESLEKVQTIPGGLEGLVIGYVKECTQHPNADRLRITKVDIGGAEELQVVCGAPNVAAGQKVVVATVGTTVYPLSGESFKINKSKIRGEVSEGMICAEDEIGLGKSHEGILVLQPDAAVGTPAKDYFNIKDDYLFEIGLTPNRADAASHLGVARDLAAYLRIPVVMPDVSAFAISNHNLTIPVVVENEQACPRYSAVTISGVTVKESPDWLKEKLNIIGIRPINNIVDVTNYVLHELGQPLHAFDADAINGHKVVVKNCADGTPFITLDGVERKLSSSDLMICDAEKPMCIAGVFGGIGSGINDNTKNVFLESAWFNAVSVRKTSKRHGLKTDASFRFERGTDPDITITALKRAALLIREVAGGEISSEISDFYPQKAEPFNVTVTYANINRLIGKEIPHNEVRDILTALHIKIADETAEGLQLKVPPYKVDVTREVDIIEEILRIYGYNNIEISQQIKASLIPSAKPDKELVQNKIADILTANGFYELLTNSLTRSAYYKGASDTVQLLNPLSSDLDTMRQTLLYSGLEVIAYNQNRKSSDLKLYEFGKTYRKTDDWFAETNRLGIWLSGNAHTERWNVKGKPVDFYHLKAVADEVINRLNITGYAVEETGSPDLQYGLTYRKGEKILADLGSVNKQLLKTFDISQDVFYASFDWDLVLKLIRKNKTTFAEIPKYPSVRRDLSMLIHKDVRFNQLRLIAQRTERHLLKSVDVFDVYEGDKLPEGKKSYALSFILQDEEKTLTDKQIDAIMQKLILNLEKEAGVEIRKN